MLTVPDLVFSEMKFLQRDKEHSELPSQPERSPKKRKKNHKHSKEGDISTYFSMVSTALAETDGNTTEKITRHVGDNVPTIRPCIRHQSSVAEVASTTAEVPETTSFPGLVSKVANRSSSSYVTWSDSVRANSITPACPASRLVKRGAQPSSRASNVGDPNVCEKGTNNLVNPPAVVRRYTEDVMNHTQVSLRGSSNQRVYRSRSYPSHTASPHWAHLFDGHVAFQSPQQPQPLSVMTPDLVVPAKIGTLPVAKSNDLTRKGPEAVSAADTKERVTLTKSMARDTNDEIKVDQLSSSDLDQVLQQCNIIFHGRQEAASMAPRRLSLQSELSPLCERRERQARTAEFSKGGPYLPDCETHIPTMVHSMGSEDQGRQGQLERQSAANVIIDLGVDIDDYVSSMDGMSPASDIRYQEEVTEGWSPCDSGGHLIMGSEKEGYAGDDTVQHVGSGNSVVASGFWRPNRLY